MKNIYLTVITGILISLPISACANSPRLFYPVDMTAEDMKKEKTEKDEIYLDENAKKVEIKEEVPPPPEGSTLEIAEAEKKRELVGTGYARPGVKSGGADIAGAVKSDLSKNALAITFNKNFEQTWDKVLEVMLTHNLTSIDKSGGVMITGWIQDKRLLDAKSVASGIIGDTVRFVRYKYVVRLKEGGGSTEVTVIPFAQVTKSRRWHQGTPSVAIAKKLMRKIVKKMEE